MTQQSAGRVAHVVPISFKTYNVTSGRKHSRIKKQIKTYHSKKLVDRSSSSNSADLTFKTPHGDRIAFGFHNKAGWLQSIHSDYSFHELNSQFPALIEKDSMPAGGENLNVI